MKWLKICLLILVIFALCSLTACATSGSSSSNINCSDGGAVCITISTVQSFSITNPVPVKIVVRSTKDIADLHLTFHTGADITEDGPLTWENNLKSPSIASGYAYWAFDIKANQTLTFTRLLHFPVKEGPYTVTATVSTLGQTITGADYFEVLITHGNGIVALRGTPLPPFTPNETAAAYGPGTPRPTFLLSTPNPSMATPLPGGNTQMPLVATSTGQTTPYPPPPTSTPFGTPTTTPTLHPYP